MRSCARFFLERGEPVAYMIEINRHCQFEGCSKLATHQVIVYSNEPRGVYCKRHAERLVAEMDEAEGKNPEGFRRV